MEDNKLEQMNNTVSRTLNDIYFYWCKCFKLHLFSWWFFEKKITDIPL